MNDVFQEDADTDDDLEFTQSTVKNPDLAGISVTLFTDEPEIATPSLASPDQTADFVLRINTPDLPNECSPEHSGDLEEPLSESSGDDIEEEGTPAVHEDQDSLELNNNAPWNNLTRFLTEWAARSRCSDASMTSLMSGLRDLHSNGDYFQPKSFKTVLNAQSRYLDSVLGNEETCGV